MAIKEINNKQKPNLSQVEEALDIINEVNKEIAGDLIAAKVQLGLALILQNGSMAKTAWNMYYHVPDGQNAQALLEKPQKQLFTLFKLWEKGELSTKNRNVLILNLANSRFYQYAYVLNKYLPNKPKVDIPQISDISNYWEFCQQIEKHTYSYYKDLAVSEKNNSTVFKKNTDATQKQLWSKLVWKDKTPKYSNQRFIDETYKRFGTKYYIGDFYGSNFYIGGHTIVDTTRIVKQFGYTTEIHFSELDHRFSNNYWGWFTGYMGFAGYANGSMIVKYREPSSSQAINYWNKITKPELFASWKEKINKLSLSDDSLAIHNTNADLLGIHNRIRLNTYSKIIDSLSQAGYKDQELRMHFIYAFNAILAKSNFDHEGRHAIDFNVLKRSELDDDIELEYRARLSQIYFSDYPLLEIQFNIDNTPHGLANKRILEIIRNWMNESQDTIHSFDPARPTLPQADLLSNKQIKEIMKTVEPFLN